MDFRICDGWVLLDGLESHLAGERFLPEIPRVVTCSTKTDSVNQFNGKFPRIRGFDNRRKCLEHKRLIAEFPNADPDSLKIFEVFF